MEEEHLVEGETETEKQARIATTIILDEYSQKTVDHIIGKLLEANDLISGNPLYPYQSPFARRVFESLIINDGATITALFSRQSGKSETVANCVATAVILFPLLAKAFPKLMGDFKKGIWVGAFGPTDEMAETLYSRIVSRLTSDEAIEFMNDPEINVRIKGRGKMLSFSNGSLVRRQTAHPRSKIEGKTYHLILIDECQDADARVINKSITPMGTATNATKVYTGTPTYFKSEFYDQIQRNKRADTERGARQNHFEADWKKAGAANSKYMASCQKEILRIGEESDEFKLSYRLIWMLGKGMFMTSERFEELGDKGQEIEKTWHLSPIVVGIDPARKQDSTIVTAVFVDWNNPDQYGFYKHQVLNWLDLTNVEWEEQYYRIVEFLKNYSIYAVGIDVGGLGDVVASRLKVELPRAGINAEVVEMNSDLGTQSKRWKHLAQLIDRDMIRWPAHSKTRSLRTYRRFRTQMQDLEKIFQGPNVLAKAPDEVNAHDDYCDSLALACILTEEFTMPTVEITKNVFYRR